MYWIIVALTVLWLYIIDRSKRDFKMFEQGVHYGRGQKSNTVKNWTEFYNNVSLAWDLYRTSSERNRIDWKKTKQCFARQVMIFFENIPYAIGLFFVVAFGSIGAFLVWLLTTAVYALFMRLPVEPGFEPLDFWNLDGRQALIVDISLVIVITSLICLHKWAKKNQYGC